MKELLDFVSEHNFLKMGDYHFSPIMVSSSGICLEYCKKINESKCEKSPLFLCFPEKKSASLWTSVTILMNYFFEDYVNNAVLPIKFNKGDKVKIFNCIAQVERTSKEIVFLKFRDQGGIPINKKLRQQLSKVKKTRSLSLKRKFSTNYFINKKNRNAISKILVPNDPETINTNTIHSKVLLVAGRGNVKKFQESLNKIKIYEETLSKIFGYSKNLIIKPDLRDYKDFFNSKKLIKLEEFKAFLNRFYEIIEIEEARSELNIIISKLNHEEGISFELDKNILDFFQTYENDIPKLKFLEEKYPGYQESLPINLRAVIINDISQIIDYRNTINGFISKGIPVIIVSNRNLKENWELDFFERLFKKNPNYY